MEVLGFLGGFTTQYLFEVLCAKTTFFCNYYRGFIRRLSNSGKSLVDACVAGLRLTVKM